MTVICPEQLRPLLTPIGDVSGHPDNPRTGHAVDAIAQSLQEFGWDQCIVVRKADGRIVKGHGRLAAARQLGLEQVPVLFVDDDQEKAIRRMVADNRTSELSAWDLEKLSELPIDLGDLGWSELALRDLDMAVGELSILADFDDVLGEDEVTEAEERPPIKRSAVVSIMLFVKDSDIIEQAIDAQIAKAGGTRGEALAAICHQWQKTP